MDAIKPFKAGAIVGQDRTSLDADAMNELVDGVNAFVKMQISPAGFATLQIVGGSSTLIFNIGQQIKVRCTIQKDDGTMVTGTLTTFGDFKEDAS